MKKITVAITFVFMLIGSIVFTYSKQPDLTVMGFVNIRDGLGRQSIELIETFQKDLKVNFISTSKSKTKHLSPNLAKYLKKVSSKHFGKVIIMEDMLWTPLRKPYTQILESDPKSIRIAYSMWESSKIPQEWVIILNQHFDAVAVPASFLIEVYQSSGVKIPIFELPLGLNLNAFKQEPLKQHCNTPMVFGNLSACSFRKNQVDLIKAFGKAFGNDPTVRLRINCRYGEKETIAELTKTIVDLNLDNIIFTQFKLSPEEYINEMKNLDCYVSPSKGEGFSIQPREAMILGIPVIATNNTGQIPICESGLVKSIETHILEKAIYPWDNYYGYQTTCTVDELAQALIEVKNNYTKYLEKKEETRKWALQYEYSALKDLYKTMIKPKRVELGDENLLTPECLITNSPELYEKYRKAFF